MSTLTPNYGFILPGVNDPTDQDLWGGYLNENFEELDTLIFDNTLSEIPSILTTNYVLTTDDNNKTFIMNTTSGALNFTLGAASGFDNGFSFTVKRSGVSAVNFVGTVDSSVNPSITTNGAAVTIISNGTNWYYKGDYSAFQSATPTEVENQDAGKFPDAAVMKYHPGVSKAEASFLGMGSVTQEFYYNIDTITRSSQGVYAVVFDDNMANDDYAITFGSYRDDGGSRTGHIVYSDRTASGFTIRTYGNGTASNTPEDHRYISFTVFGELA